MKIEFGELLLEPHGEANWRVAEDFACLVTDHYFGQEFTTSVVVPKDFVTDLASTPRLVWGLFPPFGFYTHAAVLHDFLYSTPHLIPERRIADEIFFAGCQEHGLAKWKCWLMWACVRGWWQRTLGLIK